MGIKIKYELKGYVKEEVYKEIQKILEIKQ